MTHSLLAGRRGAALRVVFAVLVAAVLALALGPAPAGAWPLWEATTLASSTNGVTSIALDPDGQPHIAYAGYRTLKVAEWNGSAWHHTTVASPCVYEDDDISLALHPDGHLAAVSFYDICTERVRLGRGVRSPDGTAWSWQILELPYYDNIDFQTTEFHSSAVAIDAAGGIHVVIAEDAAIYYTVHRTVWSVLDRVDDPAHNGFWDDVSIALDNASKAHISFINGTSRLTYAYPASAPGSGWNLEDVATISGPDGADAALVLSGGATPRIAFHDTAARSLKYAARTAANAWTVVDVDTPPAGDTAGDAGEYAALALDPSGNPHIAYKYRYSPDDQEAAAKHAYWDGTAWQVEGVETSVWGDGESLVVDSAGTVHVTYVMYSSPEEQLRYARRTEGTGTPPAGPDTFIDSSPPRLTNGTATFTFHSDDDAATFQCRNNHQAWMSCTSPHNSYTTDGDGTYTFFVRATAGGLTDPSPAFYTWTRDTTKPDSYIITGPGSPSASSEATFTFRATDASPVTFRCRVVPRVYVPGDVWPDFADCTSPQSFYSIDDGDWVFELMATDAAGNAETYHDAAFDWWTIDLPGPSTTITAKPPALTNSTTATFEFTSDDPAALFQCELNGSAWAACTSPASFAVAQGNRRFSVRATTAGGPDPIPATYSWTVDTTPPMAYIDTHPPLSDQLTTATFTFHSNDATATFECQLNGGGYSACATPKTYSGLAQGNHTFHVRAVDAAGNVSPTPGHYAWYTAGPPQTSIYYPDPLPAYTTSTSISFLAASNKTGSTYECQLDGGAFAACTGGNGQSYSNLTPGTHTFAARATDSLGQPDPTPAVHTWVIDPYWPDTRLDGRPANPSNSAAPRFLFSSGSPGATFECRLDAGTWSACTNPKDYSGLTNGSHTFEVRATSGAGIVDPTPAGTTWTIALAADTTAPDTTITQQPASPTNQARATYAFSSADAAATFECSFNDTPFAACISPATYSGTYSRELKFKVRARDDKGNLDASPAEALSRLQLDQEPGVLALGDARACALRPDGSVDCWGSNSDQTGPFTAIAANDYATCGLRPDGSARCWGSSNYGGTDQAGPFTQISGGAYSFCGVKTDNSVACWGWNANGQAANQTGPYTLASAGTAHTCAMSAIGAVTCWGDNSSGQLSAPSGEFYRLVSGYTHSCAMKGDGSVDCWGGGLYGQNADQTGPYTQLTAGTNHNCALKADGSVDCWGRNDYGQAADQNGPYVTLAAGGHFTCALRADGSVDCWGINPDGRADDQAGPFGPTALDAFAPDTLIDSGPDNPTETTGATFTFRGNEYGATFECALDGAAFAACTSPQNYAGLATGAHTFQVRATDASGNTDATPAEHVWTISAITPPETTIETKPAALTNSMTAAFTFSSNETGSTFECKLDTAAFAVCTSPKSYTGLTDGSHTFEVKAIDSGGTPDPTPASHTWTVDTTAPDTTLTGTPANPSTSGDASFTFSSEIGATFECQLDTAAFAACTSPKSYTGLSDGSHTFQARAKDAAGNTDASPASFSWSLDATPPETSITGRPDATTTSTTADFTFTGVDAATFECQLDTAAFAACASPKSYTGLGSGSHTFQVRAKDAEGRYDPTPASYTWTVDVSAPETTITSKPTDPSNDATPDFAFTSDDPGAYFYCQTDANGWFPCGGSSITYYNLDEGTHTFSVKAEDALGNVDPTPATWSWTMDLTAPETTISVVPAATTFSTTASFEFTSSEPGAFECKLDSVAWAACTSPKNYTGLNAGSHTFNVRATDEATNVDASPAAYTWTVDTTAPTVTINQATGQADPTSAGSINFTVIFNEAVTGFATGDVTLSGTAGATTAAVTGSGTSYNVAVSGMTGSGTVTAAVAAGKAQDAAGNSNVASTSTDNTVTYNAPDTTPPETTIDTAPPALTNNNDPSFAFSSNEAGGTFTCAFDNGTAAACNSGAMSYSDVADGPHTFAVYGCDAAGNCDATPATRTWTIDTAPPETTLDAGPTGITNNNDPSFAFSSNEAGGTFTCALDNGTAAACNNGAMSYSDVADGPHTFSVLATDAAGNADASPATDTWTIDTIGPDTTINSGPEGVTSDNTPAFTFSSEPDATFACKLDGGDWAACASPQEYGVQPDGDHTFRVRATDATGNPGPAAERAFTVDSAAPSVTIDTHPPALTNYNDPTFTFSGEAGAALACKLDDGAFAPCDSPKSYTNLADGEHTFAVQATDAAGNSAEAAYTWTIDTAAPDTSIITAPADITNSNDPSFSFNSTEPGGSFTCRLDGGTAVACATPQSYTDLSDGPHTFAVFATDAAGNADASAATDTWTIDTVAPVTTITAAPPNPSTVANATFQFSSESGATFECRLDGGAWATCTSPKTYAALSDGSHTFEVRATDAAGNTSDEATSTWTIRTGAIYVTAAGGTVPGAGKYQKNDILKFDGSAWSVWFDGVAEGMPATADIMAFDIADEETGAAWIVVRQAAKLPGAGRVEPTQIVTTNGATTWSLFFDGRDVGLKASGERINGLEVLPGGVSPIGNGCLHYLLISTVAGGGVPIGATNVNFTGEDVLGFCMTQSGPNTAGVWHVLFEGESQGLQKNNNYGVSANDDATTLYFTAKSNFTGDGGLVRPSQLFSFSGGVFSGPLWKAADHGLTQVVDGIDVVGDIP